MMKRETIPISKIYVPAKRRGTLDPKKAQELAESILQKGQQVPILVRQDGAWKIHEIEYDGPDTLTAHYQRITGRQ